MKKPLMNLIVATAITLQFAGPVWALTPEEKGRELARQIDERDNGFGDSAADMTMTLTNEAGDTTLRELSIKTLEVDGDGDKTIILFHSPRDVKGTALLTWSYALEDDDQWLYLPALSRVKRISSDNKTGPFMGSEFSYEDLSSQELDKYTYRYVREDVVDGVPVHVSERFPAYPNSGYVRQITSIEQSTLNVLKIEYHDRGDKLLKTLYLSDYRQYPNGKWRAHNLHMVNHQSGKTSTLEWGPYSFDNQLAESLFTRNRLKSIR
ncbi:MAG: outer membrane lipoprotein-sorting protein [Granulosicoccus sp.]